MKMSKTTVNAPTRKLKAVWTQLSREDYHWIPLKGNSLVSEDVQLEDGINYLVDCADCTQARRIKIVIWLVGTFNTGYRVDGRYIVFEEEKHRTLMLMRWGGA